MKINNREALPFGGGLPKKGNDMEIKVQQNQQGLVITNMRQRMRDISLCVSWREIANTYFKKSASWFYHKLDGIDGNGGNGGFTPEEANQLYGALIDLSDRIRRAADGIKGPGFIPN